MQTTTRRSYRRKLAATGLVAVLALGGATACSDEDGDGAVTDEEIQDVEDGAEDVGDQVEEEIEGQDEGTNEDDE